MEQDSGEYAAGIQDEMEEHEDRPNWGCRFIFVLGLCFLGLCVTLAVIEYNERSPVFLKQDSITCHNNTVYPKGSAHYNTHFFIEVILKSAAIGLFKTAVVYVVMVAILLLLLLVFAPLIKEWGANNQKSTNTNPHKIT